MAYSQGAQKTDILKQVSFWVISSYTGVKTYGQKQVPVILQSRVTSTKLILICFQNIIFEKEVCAPWFSAQMYVLMLKKNPNFR
jgi:hypothetical protein